MLYGQTVAGLLAALIKKIHVMIWTQPFSGAVSRQPSQGLKEPEEVSESMAEDIVPRVGSPV